MHLKVPPPIIFLINAILIWLLSFIDVDILEFSVPNRVIIYRSIWVVGFAVACLAIIAFALARTTVNPHHPEKTNKLVTGGINRLSRKQMYLGLLILLFGLFVRQTNLLGLIPILIFMGYLTIFQIIPEEKQLEKIFGNDYLDYKKKVRRWL
jgi:protein-S-isoprenylcysteine O-methyltransferase Ste14